MGKKLYVGNLAYTTSSADLEQMFAPYGHVESAQVIEDRDTGRSKGFGFVEMGSDSEAQAAIKAMHGQVSNNRTLTVNEARPREERGGGAAAGSPGSSVWPRLSACRRGWPGATSCTCSLRRCRCPRRPSSCS